MKVTKIKRRILGCASFNFIGVLLANLDFYWRKISFIGEITGFIGENHDLLATRQ
ncbi:hypothetical protein MM300_11820 [Evansella sp. LMS18]|uniref:hypothetical protein n=1 Tax=Evansella sp. LMS18 TaxID=2924033 RepID=UPI0020D05F78|nr:hypothetical protein [Evansella sp. LMS18]UTR08648.1 hypothetical protein MM300_11820 [Evansella sp. LMS18]